MQVPSDVWRRYIAKLTAVNEQAAAMMRQYALTHDISDRKATITYAAMLTRHYGDAAAELACEMYEYLSKLGGKDVDAEPADIVDMETIAKAVTATSANPDLLASAISRLVKQVAADTTLHNAIKYGAEVAWITRGDTCAFCVALASRGWEKASKDTLKNGHAEHIHGNCDCYYAVRYNDNDNVEGYDPQALADVYQSAAEGKPAAKINAMRRSMYAQNAEKIRAQKRAAYAAKKEREAAKADS